MYAKIIVNLKKELYVFACLIVAMCFYGFIGSAHAIYNVTSNSTIMDATTVSGDITSSGGSFTLTFNITSSKTISGSVRVSNLITIQKSGAGTLTLSGVNTYTGATTISAGTLIGDISSSVGVAVTGIYDLNGTARTLIDPSGAGTIQSSAGSAALTITSTNGSTFSGTLASTLGGLTKNGSGTLILSGTNSMASGATTTISAGTLQIGAGSTTGSITSNSIINNGSLVFNRSDAITYSGMISGTGAVTKSGSGTLTLPGVNTYTGATTISAGILNISSANGIGSGSSTLTLSGGTLQAGVGFTLSRAIALTSSTNSVIDTQSYPMTVSGIISGAGNLIKSGSGTLILPGVNTYTGATTISSGILNIYSANGIGLGSSALTLSGGALQAGGFFTLSRAIALTSSTNSTVDTQGYLMTVSGIISGAGNLIKSGFGTLTLSGVNTYTGATTISAGTLIGDISSSVGVAVTGIYDLNGTARTLIDPSGAGTIQSSAGSAALTITSTNGSTFAGTLASTLSSLIKNGTGTLILSGTNSFSGSVYVAEGELDVSDPTTQLNNATYVKLGNGATLKFTSGGALPCPLVL